MLRKFRRSICRVLLGVMLVTTLFSSTSLTTYAASGCYELDADEFPESTLALKKSTSKDKFLWIGPTVSTDTYLTALQCGEDGIVYYTNVATSFDNWKDAFNNNFAFDILDEEDTAYSIVFYSDVDFLYNGIYLEYLDRFYIDQDKCTDDSCQRIHRHNDEEHSICDDIDSCNEGHWHTEFNDKDAVVKTLLESVDMDGCYLHWLEFLFEMYGGTGKATADNNTITIQSADDENVYVEITKSKITVHALGYRKDITNAKWDSISLGMGEGLVSCREVGDGNTYSYTALAADMIYSCFTDFDEQYNALGNYGTSNGIYVDTQYLNRNDNDDYIVYYNASYALNQYALDKNWGASSSLFNNVTFEDYKPSTVMESRLKPSDMDDMLYANLWLQQELFLTVFDGELSFPTGEVYTKRTGRFSTGTTNKLTDEDIINAATEASSAVKGSTLITNSQNITLNYEYLVKYMSVDFSDNVEIYGNIEQDEVNLNAIQNNVVLDGLRETTYENAKDIQPRVSGPLPVAKKIPVLTEDSQVETYYNVVYYTLVADGYMTGSFLDYSNGNYVCEVGEDIRELADGKTDAYVSQITLSSKQARFVRSVISLYEGMEYLGINMDYSKSMKVLMEYYDVCKRFENNETVDKYSMQGEGEPLKMFFSATDELLSEDYLKGVAISASYIPLKTNLYYPDSMALMADEEFITGFHYKYGFYRKALFIDNSQASAVDDYITDLKGTQRVATLEDLFHPESDIILYVDNNFYNADELAEKQDYVYDAIRNTESSGSYGSNEDTSSTTEDWDTSISGITDNMFDENTAEDYFNDWSTYFQTLFDIDFENIVKTGTVNEYSVKFFQGTSNYGDTKYFDQVYDLAVWDDLTIDTYLDEEEYSVAQSYAVVSSIYKNTDTFNLINKEAREMHPVFVSSPTLAAVDGITEEQFNTIYNYLMLKNLDNNLSYDYKSTLDMDSPLFIDIYGNIITESGLVVIPAASNATLVKPDKYTPWTAGFLSLYAGDYHLEEEYNNSSAYMSEYFMLDEETGTWELKAKTINGVYMNFTYLPMQSDGVMKALIENFEGNVTSTQGLPFAQRAYLITEVLRGAPLENINYEKEGIVGNRSISKTGLSMAYKLDDLVEQFLSDSNGNSLVTLPNLAFMDGVEYVILFLFKFMFAATMLGMIISVYKDCVSGSFGLKSMFSGVMSIAISIIAIASVPQFLDYSYYTANKVLLKDDIAYIAMLNLEKGNQGKEIGIGEIVEPQSSTELYIKLDNISIPWYDMFDDVLLADTFTTMTQVYEDAFEDNPMSQQKYVQQKANGLYISVDDIMGSSSVGFSLGDTLLYQSVTDPNVFSYSSPYYVILDQLIANVNAYNLQYNILNYKTEIARDGSIKTTGMISSYFLSDYFMGDNYDITGLHTLYEDNSQKIVQASPFAVGDIEKMKLSVWYPDNKATEEITNIVDELELYAKNYVLENRELLEKVSDETFLKIMALQLALEHNRLMHTQTAQTIEIFNIDSKDLLRLMVGDKASVFRNSSYTFARYVYEDGGTFAVIMMGCLTAVIWMSSLLKPSVMIVILALMVISLFLRKVLFKRQSRAYEGYFISMGCFCGCNLLYSLMLKCSISLAGWMNTQASVNIILGLILQVVYVLALLKIVEFQLKDWKNIGFNEYAKAGSNIVQNLSNVTLKINDKFVSKVNPAYGEAVRKRMSTGKIRRRSMTGEQILAEMHERDAERQENIYSNPQ